MATFPRIRRMSSEDYSSVLTIDEASFLRVWDKNMLVSMVKKRDHHALVATQQGIPVGYVIFRTLEDSIEIIRLAVHPSFRGKGAAFCLMCRIKNWLGKSNGKRRRIDTIISEYNDSAHCWLRRQGFLATKVHKVEAGDYYQFEYWLDENEIENNTKLLADSQ